MPAASAYGLTGVLGQLNKARGAEPSAQYIAEGAWNPHIRCQSFYERYLRRLFGPDALDTLLKAYLLLEENEKTLGWHGRRGLFGTYHHGNRMGVGLRRVDYKQDKPKLDRPQVEKAIQAAEEEREVLGRSRGPLPPGPGAAAAGASQGLARFARRAGVRDLQDRELRHGA